MVTKRDAEILEQIIHSMSEREYWSLVYWLSGSADGSFWDYMRPLKRRGRHDVGNLPPPEAA